MHNYAARTARDINGLTNEFNKNVKLLTEGNGLITTSNIALANKIYVLPKNINNSQEEIGSMNDASSICRQSGHTYDVTIEQTKTSGFRFLVDIDL